MKKSIKEIALSKEKILDDYRIGWESRSLSIVGRKEVLGGKAKFGIFGDGKEVAQLALAHYFKDGDWRSGYYRDQTLMLATNTLTLEEFFCQLYGIPDIKLNPANGGRNFNNHFGSRIIDEEGEWKNQLKQKNSAADLSPTAGQVPRSLGLALASKLYRNEKFNGDAHQFSNNGNEIVFVTIGDASTSEGHFFEIVNSAGVLQVPLAICVWDDGYGISVEKKNQTIKSSISEALSGFQKEKSTNGLQIYTGKGWDYYGLLKIFKEGTELCRTKHIPILFHIDEITQPLGHSTSGSHERYKSKERLNWENEFDGLKQMRQWIISEKIASAKELDLIEEKAEQDVFIAKKKGWDAYQGPIIKQKKELLEILSKKTCECKNDRIDKIALLSKNLAHKKVIRRRDVTETARKVLHHICTDCPARKDIQSQLHFWLGNNRVENFEYYSSKVYSENKFSALHQEYVQPEFPAHPEEVPGRIIIRDNFDFLFAKHNNLIAFGEDVGKIGGVNQTYENLQEKYGGNRIFDTGIRETSIIGKGIGLALRGFRPIAEIQYLDYLLYALQTLSDDLASLHWRTSGGQIAPLIISTRGHRLEGIWHAGSPIAMLINALRGIYLCVPRDMTRAAGFYNTLIEGRDPAIVIEPLNGYRLKEKYPSNIGEFKIPLGIPEIIRSGTDITVVTYGANVRIALDAVKRLKEFNILVELIDIQTLLPFDINEVIVQSLKKTRKIIFFDEDVPGGATAYMMQKVLEEQGGYQYLESEPCTLTAQEHRPAYTSDGDYYSNPNSEDLFEMVYFMMNQKDPKKYPELF
jgi:pyruvate/2-oxoglutarate/acetoin dehydrogenase E1 component/TPP-dependent pyruvate/acetoin dehydrogenase alpha subunit